MRADAAAALEEMGRSLGLRALPPARFRGPIELSRPAAVAAPQRSRRALGIFVAALAMTSVALAAWNAYWLATPLRDAVATLLG